MHAKIRAYEPIDLKAVTAVMISIFEGAVARPLQSAQQQSVVDYAKRIVEKFATLPDLPTDTQSVLSSKYFHRIVPSLLKRACADDSVDIS